MANKNMMKSMPHSIEAEQAVLGSALNNNDISYNILSALTCDDFYTESHKSIFEAMQKIYSASTPIDFVTLTDNLESANLLETVGGIDYITTLTDSVPSASNYKHYVDIVKRDSILRKLITSGQKIIENSYSAEAKADAIGFAEKQIFDISQSEDESDLEQIANPLNKVIEKLDIIAKDKNALKGISTGFKDLDKITNGLQNSDLILLAARPGVGKTSLAMNVVNYAAINGKKKCAIFSLEMPNTQLAQRSLFSVANVSMEKGLKGELSADEWKSIWASKKQLSEAAIYIDDNSANTPMEILSKCRRLKREQGLDLIMIDYLQLMNGITKSKDGNRQQEISEITRSLKIAARELNVPIIVLSQLSRAVESRKDHRPMLSDLRESGSIEQDADIVIFIYKADMYNDVINEDGEGVCEVIIAKHRNGPLGTIKLRWIGESTKFINMGDKYNVVTTHSTKAPVKEEDVPLPQEPNNEEIEAIDSGDVENLW